jgi:hypothetical protein
MIGATRQIEITVRTVNQPALMGRLIAMTVSCGAEVLAASSYWDRDETVVKLVTEDAFRTTRALQAAGFSCRSNPVVLVETPDKPGLPEFLSDKLLGSGVNILYTYSFRSDRELNYVVFKTTDDDRAIYLLEVEALIHGLAAARNWRQPGTKDLAGTGSVKQAA